MQTESTQRKRKKKVIQPPKLEDGELPKAVSLKSKAGNNDSDFTDGSEGSVDSQSSDDNGISNFNVEEEMIVSPERQCDDLTRQLSKTSNEEIIFSEAKEMMTLLESKKRCKLSANFKKVSKLNR